MFLITHNTTRAGMIALVCAGFFFANALVASAAEVLVSPSTGTYSSGQTVTATIRVNPQGQSVNAVEATLTFDTSKLSVVSVSKTGSVFSLWTTEPTFSNSAGTITFGGGSPTPFTAQSTLVVVTFRATGEGSADVSFRNASVLAADGLGTDVYSGSQKATYTISGAASPTPTETPAEEEPADDDSNNAAIAFGDPPRAPEVGSKTFLDPDVWYATSSGLFTWELPFDVDEVAVEVSTSSETEPKTSYDPPIEELFLADLAEGVQYLHVQFKNAVGWGGIAHRKIQIDTEAPESFLINVRAGDSPTAFPLLTFDAQDATSGIERYELTIADREPVTVTPAEAKVGYLLSQLQDGTYTVSVRAYDKAGNMTEASTPVLITAGWLPPQPPIENASFFAFLTLTNLIIFGLFLGNCGLIGYLFYERKQSARRETKLRKETKEIQDQMEKIFSALRDEIHEQINDINKKPRLSKSELKAVESLNSALEVSETLLEKEIVDVQKILK